jgi:hypothetical protein
MMSSSKAAQELFNNEENLIKTEKGVIFSTEALNLAQNNLSKSSKLATIGFQALATAGNMLLMWGISKIVSGLYDLSQISNDVAQKAKDLGASFQNTNTDINGYKTQILDLYTTINNTSSSIEDVTAARKQLLTIQDELIDKYGEEKNSINLVTEAINGQTDALDKLTQKQWQDAKNEFNDSGFINNAANFLSGYSDNIDRMLGEYGDYTARIRLSDFILDDSSQRQVEQFKATLRDSFGAEIIFDASDGEIEIANISGTASEVYDKLLAIQSLADEFHFSDAFENDLTRLANSAKEVSDKYSEFWDQYILQERILKDDSYTDYFKNIVDAYEDYQEAFSQGNQEQIDSSVQQLSDILSRAAANIDDSYVVEYFNGMYPELQAVIDKWKFRTQIIPEINTAGLNGKTEKEILEILQAPDKSSNPYAQAILDVQSGKAAFDQIATAAKESGFILDDSAEEIQKLIDLLVDLGIVQRELSAESPIIDTSKWDYSTTLQKLGQAKESLSVLDPLYAKLSNSGVQLGFEDFSSIYTAFSNVDGIDNYIQRIQEAGQNTNEVTAVINELVSAYLDYSGVLTHVTEDNKNLIISSLEEMGILNAEELVMAQLNQQAEMLAIQKQFAAEKGYELADASLAEAAALLGETGAVSVAEQQLARLALEKIHLNHQSIDTSADIDNVIALANAAQASAEVIAQLTRAKNIIAAAEKTSTPSALGKDYYDALSLMKQLENGTYNFHFKSINPDIFKVPKNTPVYSGGNGSSTPITQAGTAIKDTSQEIVDAINAQIDALEREKKAAQESYQAQIDDLDDLIKEKQKQIDAINDEADAIKEASEARKRDIDLQKAQYDVARAENQRVKLIYSQGQGLQYSTDTTEIRDKREKVTEIQEDLEIARLKKQADLIQDEIDALEEKKDLIKEAMEESNKYYEGLIEDLRETAKEAQKTAQEMERTATAASRVRSLRSGGSGFAAGGVTGDGALQGDANQQTDLNGSIQGIAGSLGEIPDVQETLYGLSDAFFSLGEAIQSVSDALGIGEEGTISKVVEALNAIGTASLSGEEDGIIAQFERLKEAVNNVSAAVSGGGSKGEPGAPKKLEKKDGSASSLTDAITELRETTEEALGSGESQEGSGKSGEGTGVIGKFAALKTAVDDVTNAIGTGGEGENEEGESTSLIGALREQDATASQVLPKETSLFEAFHSSIELCVSALNAMIAALQEIQSLGGPAGISSSPSKAILGQALAKGYNGLPRTMKNALRSEYGQPELTVYPNGKTELTTQPVMSDLPKGTVVYNARQTDAILRGKTKAVPLSQGMVLPGGQTVVPYVPEKSALPLSSLSLIPSAPEIRRDPVRMASAVQQVSVRNMQPVVHNTVHMSLPNVTNNSGVEYIEKELGHLSLRALQEPLRKY